MAPTPAASAASAPLAHDAFPHIVDQIFATASPPSLLALRTACCAWRDRADALLVHHLRFDGDTFRTPSPSPGSWSSSLSSTSTLRSSSMLASSTGTRVGGGEAEAGATGAKDAGDVAQGHRIPLRDWLDNSVLTAAVRILDITPLPPGSGSIPARLSPAARFRELRVARIGRVLDYWEHGLFEVDTAVLPYSSGGGGLCAGHFDFLRKQVRRRVVVHVPPRWPERLFVDLGVMLRFGRAREVTLVFSGWEEVWARPRRPGLTPGLGLEEEEENEEEEEYHAGPAVGIGLGHGLRDGRLASDPFKALDVIWPHLVRGKLAQVTMVNTGRTLSDWPATRPNRSDGPVHLPSPPPSPSLLPADETHNRGKQKDTEWHVWRRFEQMGHRAPEECQFWTRGLVIQRAHEMLRFMSLDEYLADVGEGVFELEMGM